MELHFASHIGKKCSVVNPLVPSCLPEVHSPSTCSHLDMSFSHGSVPTLQPFTGSPDGCTKWSHRMVWLARDFKGHLIQIPCHGQGCHPLDRIAQTTSSLVLNSSRDGASTISLGKLCQCLNNLPIKDSSLISYLNLLSVSLKPFSLVLS